MREASVGERALHRLGQVKEPLSTMYVEACLPKHQNTLSPSTLISNQSVAWWYLLFLLLLLSIPMVTKEIR